METIQITLDSNANLHFFIELLHKFDFVKHIEMLESEKQETPVISESLKERYAHLPIEWGNQSGTIDDLAGIWEGRNITLKQIRDKAWKRE